MERRDISISGQVGKSVVYYVAYGQQLQRRYVKPSDPQSPAQDTQRQLMEYLWREWKSLTSEERELWSRSAESYKHYLSGWNYFFKTKRKGVEVAVNKVVRGDVLVVDGVNVVTIPEVRLNKSILLYNPFFSGTFQGQAARFGIVGAFLSSPTEITVYAAKTVSADLHFTYEVIEFI